MSNKEWFSNHGQALVAPFTIGSFFIALLANWNSIKNQDLLGWWPVVVIPTIVYFAFRIGRLTKAAPVEPVRPPVPEPAVSPAPAIKGSEAKPDALENVFVGSKVVKLGDFWELPDKLGRARVSPRSFGTLSHDREAVELQFDTSGSVFYCGKSCQEIRVNRMLVSATALGHQAEEHSVYQYSFSEKHVHVVIVRVDHINQHATEVTLVACTLLLHLKSLFELV